MKAAGAELIAVVPARNEQDRLPFCLGSLTAQTGVRLRVLMSDNASTDDTSAVVKGFAGELSLTARTVGPLGPSEHFVSAIRWALSATDGEVFAVLAGDDTWAPGFAAEATALLAARPEIAVVFPRFVWQGDGTDRVLDPVSFSWRSSRLRRLAALALPDNRELSNLVYGVYRRPAFEHLAEAWAAGGDEYGADFAAAWSVIGAYRVAACKKAVGRRHVRAGADLLERIGFRRSEAAGAVGMMSMYVRLSLATNAALAGALRRVDGRRDRPRTRVVQLVRAPQSVWGAACQVRGVVSARVSAVVRAGGG